MYLIAPTEPERIRELGKTSLIPERYGADILFAAQGRLVGIQRKTFPDDFLASLYDGRLQKEIVLMRQLGLAILLLEGKGRWTLEGALLDDNRQFTRRQLRGIIWSLRELGIHTDCVDTMTDTVGYIQELKLWAEKKEHISLIRRPKLKDTWNMNLSGRDWAIYVLQALPDVGPKLAGAIYDTFGCVPLTWTCSKKEMLKVPGIGKKRLEKLWNVFSNKNNIDKKA